MTMAEAMYVLCLLTSASVAALLVRSWRRTRERILIWSAACFARLAAHNCALFVDLVLLPQVNLAPWRNRAALRGVASLLAGLIWESAR
jgi:Family of unknown function (DUF5985)